MTANGQLEFGYCELKDEDEFFLWQRAYQSDDDFVHKSVELGKRGYEELTPEEHQIILLCGNNRPDITSLQDLDCGSSRLLDTIEEENSDDLFSLSDGGSLGWGSWDNQSTGSSDDRATVVELPLGIQQKLEVFTSGADHVTEIVTNNIPGFGGNCGGTLRIEGINEFMLENVTEYEVQRTSEFVAKDVSKGSVKENEYMIHNTKEHVPNNNSIFVSETNETDNVGDTTIRVEEEDVKDERVKFVTETQIGSKTNSASVSLEVAELFGLKADKKPSFSYSNATPDFFTLKNNNLCGEESISDNRQLQRPREWKLNCIVPVKEERTNLEKTLFLSNHSKTIDGNVCELEVKKEPHHSDSDISSQTLSSEKTTDPLISSSTFMSSQTLSTEKTTDPLISSSAFMLVENSPKENGIHKGDQNHKACINDGLEKCAKDSKGTLISNSFSDCVNNINDAIKFQESKNNPCLKIFDGDVLMHSYSNTRKDNKPCLVAETCVKSEKSAFLERGHAQVILKREANHRTESPNNGCLSGDENYSFHGQNVPEVHYPCLTTLQNNDLRAVTLALQDNDKEQFSAVDYLARLSDQVSRQKLSPYYSPAVLIPESISKNDILNSVTNTTHFNENCHRSTRGPDLVQCHSDTLNTQSVHITLEPKERTGNGFVCVQSNLVDFTPGRKTGVTSPFHEEGCVLKESKNTVKETGKCLSSTASNPLGDFIIRGISCHNNVSFYQKTDREEADDKGLSLGDVDKQTSCFQTNQLDAYWPNEVVKFHEDACSDSRNYIMNNSGSALKELNSETTYFIGSSDGNTNIANSGLLTERDEVARSINYVCDETNMKDEKRNILQEAPLAKEKLIAEDGSSAEQLTVLSSVISEANYQKRKKHPKFDDLIVRCEMNMCEKYISSNSQDRHLLEGKKGNVENEICICSGNNELLLSQQDVVELNSVEFQTDFNCKQKNNYSSVNNIELKSASERVRIPNTRYVRDLPLSCSKLVKNDSKFAHRGDISLDSCYNSEKLISDCAVRDKDLITSNGKAPTSFSADDKISIQNDRSRRLQKLLERDRERKARKRLSSSQETTTKGVVFPAENYNSKTYDNESSLTKGKCFLDDVNELGTSKLFSALCNEDKTSEIIVNSREAAVASSVVQFKHYESSEQEESHRTSEITLGGRVSPEGSAASPEPEELKKNVRKNWRRNTFPPISSGVIYNWETIPKNKKYENDELYKYTTLSSKRHVLGSVARDNILCQPNIKTKSLSPTGENCYYNDVSRYVDWCHLVSYDDSKNTERDVSSAKANENKNINIKDNISSEGKHTLKSAIFYPKNNHCGSEKTVITSLNSSESKHSVNYEIAVSTAKVFSSTVVKRTENEKDVSRSLANKNISSGAEMRENIEPNPKTGLGGSIPDFSSVISAVLPERVSVRKDNDTSRFHRTLGEDRLVRRRRTRSSPDLRQLGYVVQCLGSVPLSALLSKPVSERIQELQTRSKGQDLSSSDEKVSLLKRQCSCTQSVKDKAARFEVKQILSSDGQGTCTPKHSQTGNNVTVDKGKLQNFPVLHSLTKNVLAQPKYQIFSSLERRGKIEEPAHEKDLLRLESTVSPKSAREDNSLVDVPVCQTINGIENISRAVPLVAPESGTNTTTDNKNNRQNTSRNNGDLGYHIITVNECSGNQIVGSLTSDEIDGKKLSDFKVNSKLEIKDALLTTSHDNSSSREPYLLPKTTDSVASVEKNERLTFHQRHSNHTTTEESKAGLAPSNRSVRNKILKARNQFFDEKKNSETQQVNKEKVDAFEKLESFRRRMHVDRAKLMASTPDLAASVEAAVRSSWRGGNRTCVTGNDDNRELGNPRAKPYRRCTGEIVWPSSLVQRANRQNSVRIKSIQERSKSLGYLETNVDTLESREVLGTETCICDQPQRHSPLSRAQSMAVLRADNEIKHPLTTLDSSRARSMDFLLDEENRQATLPPENTLSCMKTKSEYELRIERSLNKLTLPQWYKGSAKEGFILKRREGRHPSWQGLGSKTPSSSSLASSSISSRNLVALQKVAHPEWQYTDLSEESLSVGTSGVVSPQDHHISSRRSSSRLSTHSAPPCSAWEECGSFKKPYLGWRAARVTPTTSGSVFPRPGSLSGSPEVCSMDTSRASVRHHDRDVTLKITNKELTSYKGETLSLSHPYSSDVQRRWKTSLSSCDPQPDSQSDLTVLEIPLQSYHPFKDETKFNVSHISCSSSPFNGTTESLSYSRGSADPSVSMCNNKNYSALQNFENDILSSATLEKYDHLYRDSSDCCKKYSPEVSDCGKSISRERYSYIQSHENQLMVNNCKENNSRIASEEDRPKVTVDQQVIWVESSFVGQRPTTSMVVIPSESSAHTEDKLTSGQHFNLQNINSSSNHHDYLVRDFRRFGITL